MFYRGVHLNPNSGKKEHISPWSARESQVSYGTHTVAASGHDQRKMPPAPTTTAVSVCMTGVQNTVTRKTTVGIILAFSIYTSPKEYGLSVLQTVVK